jgi:hypothetical protein
VDESMTRLKKVVYKNRIRVKDFLCDFDRLRSGVVHENNFITGLSIAGIDKKLSPQQISTIVDAYRVKVTPSLSMIDWVKFVEDVECIFTVKVKCRNLNARGIGVAIPFELAFRISQM